MTTHITLQVKPFFSFTFINLFLYQRYKDFMVMQDVKQFN